MIDLNGDLVIAPGIVIPARNMNLIMGGGHQVNQAWLQQLPEMLNQICNEFQITLIPSTPELSYHLVLFGESAHHGPIALKLAPPSREMVQETLCATIMGNGPAYPDVIAADPSTGWILLHRVIPGTTMQHLVTSGTIDDLYATELAAHLLQSSALRIDPDTCTDFPSMETWLDSLFTYAASGRNILPAEQLDLAVQFGSELRTSNQELYLLHGDFHHGNILQDESSWKIIDPKGVLAGLAFEIGPWMYNPVGVNEGFHTPERMVARLNIFSQKLGVSYSELWKNALVGSVLSDCWTLEDGGALKDCHFNTVTAALMALAGKLD